MSRAFELDGARPLAFADVVLNLDDPQPQRFVVHQVADYEAQVAVWTAGCEFQAALG